MNDQTTQAPAAEATDTKVRIRPDLNRYIRAKSGNGKRTHRTDDFIARTLDGKNIDQIKEGATKLGVDFTKWLGLNIGQQRMLIGNKLRHFIERTKTLTEEQVTEAYGEPVAPYDAEAAAAAKAAAEAAKAAKAEALAAAESGEGSMSPDIGAQPEGAGTHDISGKPKKVVKKK